MKRFIVWVALILLCAMFAGVAAADDIVNIGVIQLVQHSALDASYQGFVDALRDNGYIDGENIAIDYQNGQGDQSILATIADRFVGSNPDIILAIATPAALAVAGKTTTIPILGTAITDYVEARLAESNEKPGANVSGTTDMSPIDDQIALIVKLAPNAQTIGVIYNSGEVNSVVQKDIAKASIESRGLKFTEVTVTSSNEVQQGIERLVKECDAVYIPTDNVLASSMPIVYGVAVDAKIPVITGEVGMVQAGALATVGIDYYNLGYQTGEMAVRLIKDDTLSVSDMPIESQTSFEYYINKAFADEIGIEIPEDLAEFAH